MNTATADSARAAAPQQAPQTIEVLKELSIEAPVDVVWESILEEIGPAATGENGPMPMKIEAWPGGRWFRDLGQGAGHLWGHVQVIKPPKLLEICGPMFMSYPVVNHVQYRLTPEGGRTQLKFTHRGLGLIDPKHGKGVNQGWAHILEGIRRRAEKAR